MLLGLWLLAGCDQAPSVEGHAVTQIQAQPSGIAAEQAALLDLYRQALAAGEDEIAVYGAASDTPWQPL